MKRVPVNRDGPRFLIADDHEMFAEALRLYLEKTHTVVGLVRDGYAMVTEALRLRPDVIVTDITMPVVTGIDAVIQLRKSWSSAKVVFLTVHSEEEFLKACMAEGASGYVLKSRMKAHLIPAIDAALEGRTYISPFVPR